MSTFKNRKRSQDLQDYYDCESPSQKRRVQRKIISSIDAANSSKHHYKNIFGLDFSLLQNPMYNPFPNKNNDFDTSTVPLIEEVKIESDVHKEDTSIEKHNTLENLPNLRQNNMTIEADSLSPYKEIKFKIKLISQVFPI